VVEGATAAPEPLVPDTWEYARIVEYEPQRVELEVRCTSRCLAVLTDLFYPGWQAHVDADPVDTLRTNYLVRGVLVPTGTHRVRFTYAPARWRAAASVSAVAAFVLLIVGLRAAWSRWATRARGDEPYAFKTTSRFSRAKRSKYFYEYGKDADSADHDATQSQRHTAFEIGEAGIKNRSVLGEPRLHALFLFGETNVEALFLLGESDLETLFELEQARVEVLLERLEARVDADKAGVDLHKTSVDSKLQLA
jgi:hypothetical protein